MPRIAPAQLRALAHNLATDGRLEQAELKQLLGEAIGDEVALAPELKAELEKVLVDFGDALDTGGTKDKLAAFLDIKDPALAALSFKAEADGVVDVDDAKQLIALAQADGSISGDEKFSLGAILLSSTLSAEARRELSAAAGLEERKVSSSPALAIPDNDPAGVRDSVTVDAPGKVTGLSIDLDLDHTWRGDLKLTLVAPDGTEVLLHDKTGRSADDLKGNFPGTLTPAEPLDKLIGTGAKGEWQLHVSDNAGRDLGTLNSWSLNVTTLGAGEVGPPDETKNLDPTGAFRPVHLRADGVFVSDPAISTPTPADVASGLFNMASLVDDKKSNPFADSGLSFAQKESVFERLQDSLVAVASDSSSFPFGLTEAQALQQRSSTVTCLMGLIESLKNDGDDGVLKQNAFRAYTKALDAEKNPVLRDSMIFNLMRAKDGLTTSMKDKVEDLAELVAPTRPPYDKWFEGGNDTLNISWTCGQGEDFMGGTIEMLEKEGFVKEDPSNSRAPVFMTKTLTDDDGKELHVRFKVMENRNSIFEDMDLEDTHIVGYDGHSDIGRNIPASLRTGDEAVGDKLIFYGLCAGKDVLDQVRSQYPNSQVLTTFNSSYFRTKDVNGRKVMTHSENFNALMQVIDGAVHRHDWKKINDNIRTKAIMYPWSHPMAGGTNYISPIHTQIRRQVLDSDHDGVADILDKFVTFDLHKIPTDTAREWQPIEPGRPADVLDGTLVHLATMALNTATGYNTETKAYKKQNIISAGFYDPAPGDDRIVRFQEAELDGKQVLELRVNKQFAHMSVEGLRGAVHYQFMREIADTRGLNEVDSKLMGLVFAAFSINYDEARWGRDDHIWKGLLEHLNLPADLPLAPLKRLLNDEHHDYSGNRQMVTQWKASIPQAVLDQLADPAVGNPDD
jgi:subtilisin-like proprotein convertase family protein